MSKKKRVEKKQDTAKDKTIHTFAGSIEEALSEDIDELQPQEDVIVIDVPEKPVQRSRLYRNIMFAVGLLVVIFAIIGVSNTVMFVADTVENIQNQTALKNELELYLYPAVSTDLPSFDKAENLPNSTIIKTAIAKILLTQDLSNYSSDIGVIFIPEFDVETAAKSLFGSSIVIEHESVGSIQDRATYLVEKRAYEVSNTTPTPNYIPKVANLSKVGETYTVDVEYYPLSVDIPGLDNKTISAKTMTYVITQSGEKKTIISVAIKEITMLGGE